VLIPFAGFSAAMGDLSAAIVRGTFLANLFWALARGIDVATIVSTHPREDGERIALAALIRVAGRIGKFVVLALAVVAFLSELGLPVASLVAGLGIGGLAFALAAQKTVENLFGALSLGADQPFKEGDMVRTDAFFGTVERVGLRSTRIRTLDRTLVTIPNGKLADMSIESFAARDRFRLACVLGLVYETREEQLRRILAGCEQALRAHPAIWPDAVVVRFAGFGDSSLNVEVMCWFVTKDWAGFQVAREEVLLSFMRVVEEAASTFAFPTRTLHIASLKIS
jgi:MscS family membrane protein